MDARPSRAPGQSDQLVMRPKLAWRLMSLALIAFVAVRPAATHKDVPIQLLFVAVFVVAAAWNWMSCIVVRDGSLFRREFLWWRPDSLDLSHLIRIDRRYDYGRSGRYIKLELQDVNGVEVIQLRRWNNWRALVRLIADHLDDVPTVDDKTRAWVMRFRRPTGPHPGYVA